MDAPRRSSRGGSHRERRSRARALGNEARHRLRHVSLRAEGCVRGEAETRAESARGRSAGAVSVSRVSRVASRVRYPRTRRGADEARIRTRAAGGGHARRAGRCREREDGDAPTRRKSRAAASRVGAAAPNAKASLRGSRSAERTAAFPSSRRARRASSRKAERRASGTGWTRRASSRSATRNEKRNDAPVVDVDWSTAGDRLVTACEAGDVRVWSRCVGASSDDEDDGSETWRCSRVVACGDDERFASRSAGTAGTGARDASRVGAPRLPAVVAARFHPLNADLFFVALSGARSVWAVNASTGRVSARLEASARSVPADLSARRASTPSARSRTRATSRGACSRCDTPGRTRTRFRNAQPLLPSAGACLLRGGA